MRCADAEKLMGGWIDQEIGAAERSALEAHLAGCAECRESAAALRALDADLSRAFQSRREAGAVVARRVIDQLRAERPAPAGAERSSQAWLPLVASAAAGFLVAILIFPPWGSGRRLAIPDQPPVTAPAARLVVATGHVELQRPGSENWLPATEADLQYASGSRLRTGPSTLCELQTEYGCTIRLNDETEVAVASGRQVELVRGEIWCRAPETAWLDVVARESPPTPQQLEAGNLSVFHCPSDSSLVTSVGSDGAVQITTAEGEIDVRTPAARHRLKRGETATIAKGQLNKSPRADDPLLAAGWIQPLLIQKGHADQELRRRVDDLLARLAEGSDPGIYEQEIRSLGEYSALPLAHHVASTASGNPPLSRTAAMRILADVAPAWSIPELIALLADEDAEVRYYAATALRRLTGQTQGRSPEQWRQPLDACAESLAQWQVWLQQHGDRYPRPLP